MRARIQAPHGFTLLELLVVIATVLILIALTFGVLAHIATAAKCKQTNMTLTKLQAALEDYGSENGEAYPSSDGDPSGLKGAENLYACLTATTPGKHAPYMVPTQENLQQGPTPRFVDAWNHPIRYFNHADYANHPPNKHSFRLISDGPNAQFENGAAGSDDIVNWDKADPK